MNFFDKAVYSLVFKLHSVPSTIIMTFISFWGSIIALGLITIGILILKKGKGNSRFIAFNLIVTYFLSQLLKLIFRRERPSLVTLTVGKGNSFPSKYAMIAVVFYGFLIYLITKKVKNKKKKRIYIGLLLIMIFLIGISRVYLGVNYATDVLVGYIFGAVYLFLILKYLYNRKSYKVK